MFREFLLNEIKLRKPYLMPEDIAKFIIQAYTGPFHTTSQEHDIRILSKKFKTEFTTKRELNREKDVFSTLSDYSMRINIIPFILKYKSPMMLANLFTANFKYFDEKFFQDIPIEDICKELEDARLKNIDDICNIIQTFNDSGSAPSHSQIYKEHFSPAYVVILSSVIKEYISVL